MGCAVSMQGGAGHGRAALPTTNDPIQSSYYICCRGLSLGRGGGCGGGFFMSGWAVSPGTGYGYLSGLTADTDNPRELRKQKKRTKIF